MEKGAEEPELAPSAGSKPFWFSWVPGLSVVGRGGPSPPVSSSSSSSSWASSASGPELRIPSLALAPLGLGHRPPHPDPPSAAAASPAPGPVLGSHGALPSPAVITKGQREVRDSGQAWAPCLLGLTSHPCP